LAPGSKHANKIQRLRQDELKFTTAAATGLPTLGGGRTEIEPADRSVQTNDGAGFDGDGTC